MKGAVPYIVIFVLAAAVAFLLWNGCKPAPSHAADKSSVDSVAAADSIYHKILLTRIDQLEGDSAEKQDEIDNESRQLAWYEAELSLQGDAIGQTLKAYDSVRIIHDTPAVVQVCDTLAHQVEAAKIEVHGFVLLSDSLTTALVAQGRIKDSMTQAWRVAFLQSDTANAFLQGKYNSLYLDYAKMAKKSSLTGKAILPAAIAGLVIGLLLKK